MSTKDHGDMRFQHRDGDDILNTNPLSNKVGSDPFGSGWNPMVSLNQSENFEGQNSYSGPSYSVAMDNQALSNTSHLVHYQSDSGLGEMVPKLSCFGSGNFSEMVNSFGLPPDCGLMSYSLNKGGIDKAKPIGSHSRNDCQNQEDKVSPDQKNKRKASDSDSPFNSNKNEAEQQNPSGSLEKDVKNQKIEQNIRGKQTGKQVTENSDSGDAAKDSYIHVRAKRGQATNSHSLAERVRREKISERMRLLQELVPGCNKITGKAVMLDEIINYVQSLQQQVEFLSMKLATVNPEVNIDIEQILSKEILNARSSNAAIHGYQGLRPTHPYPHANLLAIPNTTQAYHSMPQAVWDNDLHNLLQMGFDPNNNLGPSGRPKLDL